MSTILLKNFEKEVALMRKFNIYGSAIGHFNKVIAAYVSVYKV